MMKFETDDGFFDGAAFKPRDYRSTMDIVDFIHANSKLGIVREGKEYFTAEFLIKGSPFWTSMLVWNEGREPVICESVDEAKALISEYIKNEQ